MKVEYTQEDLLPRAIKGDQDALTALLKQHDGILRSKMRGRLPRRWQSVLSLDDLMQETYTDAYLGISDFVPRGDGSFGRWLATIAKNNLLHALESLEAERRGGARRPVLEGNQESSCLCLLDMLGGTTTSPSGRAARAEARVALDEAISKLPPGYHRVVLMYDLEGHPVEDVATAMKRSPGAVFMLRARAHRILRKNLGTPLRYFSDFA